MTYLHNLWNAKIETASALATSWGISPNFRQMRGRKRKRHFDELASDERLDDAVQRFKVTVFFSIVDTATLQLKERFVGFSFICSTFSFLFPVNLTKATNSELEKCVENVIKNYP